MGTITELLQQMREGRAGAADRLFAHVYEELKEVARQQLQKQHAGVLQPTALVNEAFERLADREALDAENRKHLFYLFGRAMHDVLVEQVRRDLADKRGGRLNQLPMIEVAVDGGTRQYDLLDLQQALSELSLADPTAARIVMLRFYAGLSLEETAAAVEMTFAVTRKHWEYAKAWMHVRLTSGPPAPSSDSTD
jgi:RNA polymerase sigma factor (TIGR02999 family)